MDQPNSDLEQEGHHKGKGLCRLHSLHNICVHEPFPTPFTDEFLDNVARNESYSFIDGLLGYHQVRILEEDKNKTTFTIE